MQTLLVFGATGTGKTVIAGEFALYQAFKHNAPCLYCGADSGWDSAGDKVAMGVMEPYNLASHPNALWALRRIARGMWPREIDPNGRAVNPSDFVDIRQHPKLAKTGISGLIIEGLSRNAELMSTQLVNDMEGIKTGEPLVSQFRIDGKGKTTTPQGDKNVFLSQELEDEEMFALPSRGTYNFLQSQTSAYVNAMKGHPHAPRILFTAHQTEGKSSEGPGRVLGPLIFGRAGVDRAPGWFGSYFHAQTFPRDSFGQGSPEVKALWYEWHADQSLGLPWPSKFGVPANVITQFRREFPYGFVPSWINPDGSMVGGISVILRALDNGAAPPPAITNGLRLI